MPAGRKLFDGKNEDEVVQKLREAFLNDANDEQACLEAEISQSALYAYQKEHPEFLQQKLLWKEDVKYKAKRNIAKAINRGDVETSKWLLPKREKQNYSDKIETEHSGEIKIEWASDSENNDSVQPLSPSEGSPQQSSEV